MTVDPCCKRQLRTTMTNTWGANHGRRKRFLVTVGGGYTRRQGLWRTKIGVFIYFSTVSTAVGETTGNWLRVAQPGNSQGADHPRPDRGGCDVSGWAQVWYTKALAGIVGNHGKEIGYQASFIARSCRRGDPRSWKDRQDPAVQSTEYSVSEGEWAGESN